MDTFEAINSRRSIKNFDKNYKMSQDEISKLLEVAILSPTSYNIQNWRFVIITEQDLKDRLSELSWGQKQVSDASLVIVLCADLKSWNKNPERYWINIPEESRKFLVDAMKSSYNEKPQVQRDEAMRSCGIAAQTLMLAAKSMGYDTCPMEGFDFDAVSRLISLPDDHVISMMVVVGKAIKNASPRGGQLPLSEIVFENSF
ncbi:MAG: nitroreductase family protein [Nitrosopumilus sp.]|jgi:nitroreductase|nr:nitroreductase family protein [Nitrosopumilus sp.]